VSENLGDELLKNYGIGSSNYYVLAIAPQAIVEGITLRNAENSSRIIMQSAVEVQCVL
jgi:hypothetical protein